VRRLLSIAVLVMLSGPAPAADMPLALSGPLVEGGLVDGRTVPGATVTLDGAPLPINPDGRFMVGFGRTMPETVVLRVETPTGDAIRRELAIGSRTYGEQRIDGLPSRQVTPNEDDLRRIRADQAQVNAARAIYTPTARFDDGWIWPAVGIVTGVYGTARFLNGEARQPHYGIDIAAPEGTPVVAPAAGRVTLAHQDMFFTGRTIIIDHGLGVSSTFLHLSEIAVADGQEVAQGELIGRVGSTGRSTGPHLDWRVNLLDARLDPALLAGPMPVAEAD